MRLLEGREGEKVKETPEMKGNLKKSGECEY